ncbi:methyl-accepting chemotaxis protein [Leptolyngbya sp. Heron Island J]|uniref:methyl-accepting chemotaxis protein n=1 Tax=Leptolyngbya sp. Heron Island J TaxID=1385935 RepID=UPI0003B99399|nr:methyl-accepting chemotaxis protein [Leptolyngbya sp. Heron Island J]ESA35670.1 methyl-accepting chemotaxis protein [Leptolyngbya sp. Heron Island J]
MKITDQLKITIVGLACLTIGVTVFENVRTQEGALDGSVVNKSGIVRGATQRLVKLETNGQPSDDLIQNLDQLMNGLINGDKSLDLPKATDPTYLARIQEVESAWQQLKTTIVQYRQNPNLKTKLLEDSEAFFELTNEAVFAAENFTTAHIKEVGLILWAFLAVDLAILGFILWSIYRVSKVLQQSVTTVADSSSDIAATVEAQERLVADQTASVHVTTSTIEQLGTSSLQAAQKANSSATGAREALDLSETGSQAVENTVLGIEDLQDKVSAIAEQIMQLSEQTDQISTISSLVADVADQTNMLALNAAVEAARAGEQGKGFAVVAGEIRKLADQSRDSAGKINILVEAIQSSINSTVMVTDEGNKTAKAGIEVAKSTANVFKQIAAAINEVYSNTQEIAQTAKQQAVGVQQAVSAMNAINLGAKETVTAVNQVQNSTEELKTIAEELQVAV